MGIVELGPGLKEQRFEDMGTPMKLCVVKDGIAHLVRGQRLLMRCIYEMNTNKKGVINDDTKEILEGWVRPEKAGAKAGGSDSGNGSTKDPA